MDSSTKYHVRSISFPSRPHPSTARVEEDLDKLEATWRNVSSSSSSSSSESLSEGVSMLEELYGRVDDLLNMGSTQQVVSRNQHDKRVEALLESSVRLLDVCGATRDLLSETNEHVGEVQSAMRRRRRVETCVSSYVCFRKKSKKEVKKLISTTLKHKVRDHDEEEQTINDDDHFVAVVRVLRRVCEVSVLVFQSLLSFVAVLSSKTSSRTTRWSGLMARFIHKGVIACEDNDQKLRQRVNEFESVDSVLMGMNVINIDSTLDICEAQRSLEALETGVVRLEKGLEIVFRRLIRTRTSLLNIISH